jgi:hypothetical protein
MATVFFKIGEVQEKEVNKMMKEEGYTNKAEFFRFLIKFYKYNKSSAQNNFEMVSNELAQVLKKLEQKGKFSKSLDEQLSDI